MARAPRPPSVRHPVRIAVSGDLVASRRAPDRRALGRRIGQVLDRLGEEYRAEFLAPPVVTRGIDEVSAVFRKPERLFSFVIDVNVALWPEVFRFGFGAGAIDIRERSTDAAAMDGPAFHHAASALLRARREGLVLALNFPAVNEVDVRVIEALADGAKVILAGWSKGVASAAPVLFHRPDLRQAEAARALKVSQPAVSKMKKRGEFGTLGLIERAAGEVLARCGRSLS